MPGPLPGVPGVEAMALAKRTKFNCVAARRREQFIQQRPSFPSFRGIRHRTKTGVPG